MKNLILSIFLSFFCFGLFSQNKQDYTLVVVEGVQGDPPTSIKKICNNTKDEILSIETYLPVPLDIIEKYKISGQILIIQNGQRVIAFFSNNAESAIIKETEQYSNLYVWDMPKH
ncbi:MAG: hypothetical protein M3P22_01150 [bacterium]|nr:hypothetical protein [bacterium]